MADPRPIPRFDRDVPSAAVVAALVEHGCAVIERLADQDMVARALAELTLFIDATAVGTDDFAGSRTRRTGGLIGRSEASREFVMHPLILDVVGGTLEGATSSSST